MKTLLTLWESWVRFLGQEVRLEKGMATHSSIPAWRIPWTEETGRLQCLELQRVRHDSATNSFYYKVSPLKWVGDALASWCAGQPGWPGEAGPAYGYHRTWLWVCHLIWIICLFIFTSWKPDDPSLIWILLINQRSPITIVVSVGGGKSLYNKTIGKTYIRLYKSFSL